MKAITGFLLGTFFEHYSLHLCAWHPTASTAANTNAAATGRTSRAPKKKRRRMFKVDKTTVVPDYEQWNEQYYDEQTSRRGVPESLNDVHPFKHDWDNDFDSDEEDKDTVEAPARFMLVERRDDLWRGYLVGAVLPEKLDTGLMLLPGRELVVSGAARAPS